MGSVAGLTSLDFKWSVFVNERSLFISVTLDAGCIAVHRITERFAQKPAVLVVAVLTIQGCVAAPPRPLVGPDPDDPNIRVPAATYRSAIGEFKSIRPSEPAAWRYQGGSEKPKKDGP